MDFTASHFILTTNTCQHQLCVRFFSYFLNRNLFKCDGLFCVLERNDILVLLLLGTVFFVRQSKLTD